MDSAGVANFAEKQSAASCLRYSENFNRAEFANEEEMQDVVESFELLHRSIPWLQRADVSSESHCGQLKILQAAIDYIIDLEEQLAEQLTGGLYMAAALQSSVELSLAAGASGARRPFADINGGGGGGEGEQLLPQFQHESQPVVLFPLVPIGLDGHHSATEAGSGSRQC